MKIAKVISGGQTGADMGGLLAASRLGIPTGGWAPKGWLTEVGPRKKALMAFGLKESHGGYPVRTKQNIEEADLTIIIADSLDGGSKLTRDYAVSIWKPCFVYRPTDTLRGEDIERRLILAAGAYWRKKAELVVNVGGNRESKSPGIQAATEKLIDTFLREFNG